MVRCSVHVPREVQEGVPDGLYLSALGKSQAQEGEAGRQARHVPKSRRREDSIRKGRCIAVFGGQVPARARRRAACRHQVQARERAESRQPQVRVDLVMVLSCSSNAPPGVEVLQLVCHVLKRQTHSSNRVTMSRLGASE